MTPTEHTTTFAITVPAVPGRGAEIGSTRVEIDGTDVTAKVRAFEVAGAVNELTRVVVWPTVAAGTIQGEGIVHVVDPDLDLAALADAIRELDGIEVQADALDRLGQGTDNAQCWLDAIADRIAAT